MRNILCLMVVGVLLVSCTSVDLAYDPLPEAGSDSAMVSLFRDQTGYAPLSASSPTFWVVAVDGRNLARLEAGEYTRFPVTGGESHRITIKSWRGWWAEESVSHLFEVGETKAYLAAVESFGAKQLIPMSEDEAAAWRQKNTEVPPVR